MRQRFHQAPRNKKKQKEWSLGKNRKRVDKGTSMKTQANDSTIHTIPYGEIIQVLNHGSESFLKEFKSVPKANLQSYYIEIENINQFLETLSFIQETMPSERLHDTLHNTVHSFKKSINNIPRAILTKFTEIPLDAKSGLPDFIVKIIHLLGPNIRISKNEMTTWVSINSEEVVFYNPEILMACLKNFGIKKGLLDDQIRDIFEKKLYDEEVCIAKGMSPVMGEDGHIKYMVDIDDLGQKPKELSSYKVSFKDIKLYEYMSEGDVLAKKIPPKPGKSGFTVTGRTISPIEAQEAVFPEMDFTKISDNDNHLLVTEDSCIKKINGALHLEPSLRIPESVSYKTGNISSKVAVIVDHDVLSGFSIISEKSIQIAGIVEGAKIEAKGSIIIRGGIQGKEKAVIDCNGDITARFISNATSNSLGNTVVESEIVNSHVWSAGQVFVTGHPGNIVSGEINADSDVVANSIGSDLGIKTTIRIGGRAQDLATMLRETQDKIAKQEEAVDKCTQIIDVLRMRESQSPISNKDVIKSLHQAEEMLEKAKKNSEELFVENDNLQKQYEDSIQKSRTVRARVNIYPGTVIDIQGVEFIVKTPTGPTMFLKQGDEIMQLPYQDIKK
jgi:uncharacterized protein